MASSFNKIFINLNWIFQMFVADLWNTLSEYLKSSHTQTELYVNQIWAYHSSSCHRYHRSIIRLNNLCKYPFLYWIWILNHFYFYSSSTLSIQVALQHNFEIYKKSILNSFVKVIHLSSIHHIFLMIWI